MTDWEATQKQWDEAHRWAYRHHGNDWVCWVSPLGFRINWGQLIPWGYCIGHG